MPRINRFQWRSKEAHSQWGNGVMAERLRGGVQIQVKVGSTYVAHDLTTAEADDLARFIIDCGIAERAATEEESA